MFLTVVINADNFNFPSAECFNYLFDVLNSGSTSDDKHKHIDSNYTDHERYKLSPSVGRISSSYCFFTIFALLFLTRVSLSCLEQPRT